MYVSECVEKVVCVCMCVWCRLCVGGLLVARVCGAGQSVSERCTSVSVWGWWFACVCVCVRVCACVNGVGQSGWCYGVATMSRLLKIIGLFCKIYSLL